MNALKNFFLSIGSSFYDCFISDKCYKMYFEGLWNTILIALGACIIGLFIGILITAIHIIPKNNLFIKLLDKLAHLYTTVIRGTPVVLQLFICYFVLLKGIKTVGNGILLAAVTFGLNSGAYMSEILRGGINSVDIGQTEASRSLGFGWFSTFLKIVLPQAVKSVIPAIFNEFITLIKETSVAGYVGIIELTKIQSYITTQTMEIYMPLFIIATIYLILVVGLQQIQKIIERRLAKSER